MSPSSSDSTPLVQVRGLKKYFPIFKGFLRSHVGDVKAVDGISFDIQHAETVAMVGESGCGKTTAGRSILRLIEPNAGTVHFRGQNLPDLGPEALREMRRYMQIIFQDPYSSLNPRQTIRRSSAPHWCCMASPPTSVKPSSRRRHSKRLGSRPATPAATPTSLGWAAPAHRHRPRRGPQPRLHRVRRGRVGTRRVGPGTGSQSPA